VVPAPFESFISTPAMPDVSPVTGKLTRTWKVLPVWVFEKNARKAWVKSA
jgi:hypothetical protein